MTFSMPKHIAVAIAGGVLAVALGAGVIFLGKGTENDPATILPDAETRLLARNVTADSLRLLQDKIQGLDGISLPSHPVDIALLHMGTKTAWVMFDATTAPAGMRFSITASDTAAQSLITTGERRLSDDASYRNLKGFLQSGPAAYLRFPASMLKPDTAILFTPTEAVAVLFEADATRIVLPEGDVMTALSKALSPSASAILQSRIRTVAASLFGTTVSPAYDILPLFTSSAFVDVRNGKNVTFATKSASDASAVVSRLHDAFAAGQPGVEVVSMPLDEQFSYTGIRKTDASVQKTVESRNGFEVTRSGGEGTIFLSAVRGSSVVLSNTEDGLSAGMDALGAAGDAFTFHADPVSVRSLFPSLEGKDVQWTANRENGRLVLEIPR